ncbi:hypothetical protein N665_0613s0015 [Sinapis alba]|nr:hypothetical protein N665_0613s0015 [Sinapis alba]
MSGQENHDGSQISTPSASERKAPHSSDYAADGLRGYEKVFKQTFECLPDEQLRKTYACYLSTSAGLVMGVMYLSTHKLAFCSDSPLSMIPFSLLLFALIYVYI